MKTKAEIQTMEMLLDAEYISLGQYFVQRRGWRQVNNRYFDINGNEITDGECGARILSTLAKHINDEDSDGAD